MNGFYKKNGLVFVVVLGMLLNSSLHAVTINNQPLENIGDPANVFSSIFPENSYVRLAIEKDNLNIGNGSVDEIHGLKEVFQEVLEKSSCPFRSGGQLSMSCGTMERSWSRLHSGKAIDLTANVLLNMVNCLLDAPDVSIIGNNIHFRDCFFINTEVLTIVLNGPDLGCTIQIEFYDQSENPTIIDGKIDLKNNEANNELIISNPKKMSLQFRRDKSVAENPTNLSNVKSEDGKVIKTKPLGLIDKSLQAIAAFSQKYITPYL